MSSLELESLDWQDIYKRLTTHTVRRLLHFKLCDSPNEALEQAEGWVSKAVAQLFDPHYKNTEASDKWELLQDLGSRVNGLLNNHQRSRATRSEHLYDPHEPPPCSSSEPSAERRVIAKEEAKRALDLLLDYFENDELAAEVLLLQAEGVDKASEQAEQLQRSIEAIYNARRRIKARCDAVRASMQAEEK